MSGGEVKVFLSVAEVSLMARGLDVDAANRRVRAHVRRVVDNQAPGLFDHPDTEYLTEREPGSGYIITVRSHTWDEGNYTINSEDLLPPFGKSTYAPGGVLGNLAPKTNTDSDTESEPMSEPIKSCNTCAYRLDGKSEPGAALDALGVPGAPISVCAKLNATLALSPEVPDERAREIGAKCEAYKAAPATGAAKELRDALDEGNVQGLAGWKIAITPADQEGHTYSTPSAPVSATCTACQHFVPPTMVTSGEVEPFEEGADFPINPYYCAARGNIHPYRQASLGQAPKYCGEYAGTSGPLVYKEGTDRSALFPPEGLFAHIREDLGLDEQTPAVEETGPDERVATDAEREQGILTFSRFFSDDGTRYVDLPIFDPDHFSPDERAKIPASGDDAAPELFRDYANLAYRIAAAWALGETPALTGAPGLGKSQAAYFLAWRMRLPLERVSITSASQLDDLAGYTELVRTAEGNATEFVHGRVPQAWAKPCILLLDEPNAGPPEVWQFLRPLTDAAKQLVLDVNHGERIARHEHSYLMMAMNPAWDYRNTGVTPLSDADGRRLVHITVTPPEPDVERDIIASHLEADGQTLDAPKLDVLVKIGSELRTLAEGDSGTSGALQITWGVAQQVKVAKLLRFFDFAEAYRLAGADNLEPEQRNLILGVVNRLSSTLTTGAQGRKRRGKKAPASADLHMEEVPF